MADTLENFRRHQESLILRMPRIVRNVTMREFAKYKGDVQAAVKGLSRQLLGSEDATIDFGTRKRKWVESQEAEESRAAKGSQETESSRGVKNGMGTVLWRFSQSLIHSSSNGGCYSQEEASTSGCPQYRAQVASADHEDSRKGA